MKRFLLRRLLPLLLTLLSVIGMTVGCAAVGEILSDEEFVSYVDELLSEAVKQEEGAEDIDVAFDTDPVQEADREVQGQSSERLEFPAETTEEPGQAEEKQGNSIVYGQSYSTVEEVAEYLHFYGELPPNYITKNAAQELGWDSQRGNLWKVADGMSIGGDRFGNYEGLLPSAKGRKYFECDVNYEGGYRGPERIIYSNDGLVYYTGDHYNTFTLLYGEE